jgi:biotin carboxyl carrier protein
VSEKKPLNIDGTVYLTEVPDGWHRPYAGPPDYRIVRAFIPGTIHQIAVEPGRRVDRGQLLLLLEAMKMYNEILAGVAATVEEVAVRKGDVVEKGQVLIRLKPLE